MRSRRHICAIALVMLATVAAPAYAQPSRPSDDIPAAIERSQKPVSKSDAYRVVGKVAEIDKEKGVFKLETEEGVVMAKPRPELLGAARVGDTVSVPRPENQTPSASPPTTPRRAR